MRFWVPEEVDDSAVLKMCSGVRLWLGMGLSLWTEERIAVSVYQDGMWIGIWTRGPTWLCVPRKAHPGRHPSARGSTPISVLWVRHY